MISVICGVRNRTENLMKVLPTWLDADGVEEVVIADWNSSEALVYKHERVRIVRVTNVDYWSLPQAFNMAARFARGDIYAKLDADYKILNTSFFTDIDLKPGTFINGIENAPTALCGLFYLYAKDFWAVHGFDERMQGWGYDDNDIEHRLIELGLQYKRLNNHEKHIEHLSHSPPNGKDNKVRFETMINGNLTNLLADNNCSKNAYIANTNPWNSSMPLVGIGDIEKIGKNIISCAVQGKSWKYKLYLGVGL